MVRGLLGIVLGRGRRQDLREVSVLIGELANAGAIPSLEATVRFAAARQELIADNISKMDLPDYRPMDVSPREFQSVLSKAVDMRRNRTGTEHGPLRLTGTRQIEVRSDGSLSLRPRTPSGNILFHDRNNRDLELLMKDNAENVGAFRVATELLRGRYELLRTAIAERA